MKRTTERKKTDKGTKKDINKKDTKKKTETDPVFFIDRYHFPFNGFRYKNLDGELTAYGQDLQKCNGIHTYSVFRSQSFLAAQERDKDSVTQSQPKSTNSTNKTKSLHKKVAAQTDVQPQEKSEQELEMAACFSAVYEIYQREIQNQKALKRSSSAHNSRKSVLSTSLKNPRSTVTKSTSFAFPTENRESKEGYLAYLISSNICGMDHILNAKDDNREFIKSALKDNEISQKVKELITSCDQNTKDNIEKTIEDDQFLRELLGLFLQTNRNKPENEFSSNLKLNCHLISAQLDDLREKNKNEYKTQLFEKSLQYKIVGLNTIINNLDEQALNLFNDSKDQYVTNKDFIIRTAHSITRVSNNPKKASQRVAGFIERLEKIDNVQDLFECLKDSSSEIQTLVTPFFAENKFPIKDFSEIHVNATSLLFALRVNCSAIGRQLEVLQRKNEPLTRQSRQSVEKKHVNLFEKPEKDTGRVKLENALKKKCVERQHIYDKNIKIPNEGAKQQFASLAQDNQIPFAKNNPTTRTNDLLEKGKDGRVFSEEQNNDLRLISNVFKFGGMVSIVRPQGFGKTFVVDSLEEVYSQELQGITFKDFLAVFVDQQNETNLSPERTSQVTTPLALDSISPSSASPFSVNFNKVPKARKRKSLLKLQDDVATENKSFIFKINRSSSCEDLAQIDNFLMIKNVIGQAKEDAKRNRIEDWHQHFVDTVTQNVAQDREASRLMFNILKSLNNNQNVINSNGFNIGDSFRKNLDIIENTNCLGFFDEFYFFNGDQIEGVNNEDLQEIELAKYKKLQEFIKNGLGVVILGASESCAKLKAEIDYIKEEIASETKKLSSEENVHIVKEANNFLYSANGGETLKDSPIYQHVINPFKTITSKNDVQKPSLKRAKTLSAVITEPNQNKQPKKISSSNNILSVDPKITQQIERKQAASNNPLTQIDNNNLSEKPVINWRELAQYEVTNGNKSKPVTFRKHSLTKKQYTILTAYYIKKLCDLDDYAKENDLYNDLVSALTPYHLQYKDMKKKGKGDDYLWGNDLDDLDFLLCLKKNGKSFQIDTTKLFFAIFPFIYREELYKALPHINDEQVSGSRTKLSILKDSLRLKEELLSDLTDRLTKSRQYLDQATLLVHDDVAAERKFYIDSAPDKPKMLYLLPHNNLLTEKDLAENIKKDAFEKGYEMVIMPAAAVEKGKARCLIHYSDQNKDPKSMLESELKNELEAELKNIRAVDSTRDLKILNIYDASDSIGGDRASGAVGVKSLVIDFTKASDLQSVVDNMYMEQYIKRNRGDACDNFSIIIPSQTLEVDLLLQNFLDNIDKNSEKNDKIRATAYREYMENIFERKVSRFVSQILEEQNHFNQNSTNQSNNLNIGDIKDLKKFGGTVLNKEEAVEVCNNIINYFKLENESQGNLKLTDDDDRKEKVLNQLLRKFGVSTDVNAKINVMDETTLDLVEYTENQQLDINQDYDPESSNCQSLKNLRKQLAMQDAKNLGSDFSQEGAKECATDSLKENDNIEEENTSINDDNLVEESHDECMHLSFEDIVQLKKWSAGSEDESDLYYDDLEKSGFETESDEQKSEISEVDKQQYVDEGIKDYPKRSGSESEGKQQCAIFESDLTPIKRYNKDDFYIDCSLVELSKIHQSRSSEQIDESFSSPSPSSSPSLAKGPYVRYLVHDADFHEKIDVIVIDGHYGKESNEEKWDKILVVMEHIAILALKEQNTDSIDQIMEYYDYYIDSAQSKSAALIGYVNKLSSLFEDYGIYIEDEEENFTGMTLDRLPRCVIDKIQGIVSDELTIDEVLSEKILSQLEKIKEYVERVLKDENSLSFSQSESKSRSSSLSSSSELLLKSSSRAS